MTSIISVQNLGKKYVLGHQSQESYTTLRDIMANGAKRFAQKLRHPFAASENSPTHEDFWALKDVNFDIQQGERVGIIGRNGAGKSTLLKILSRITEPTVGQIKIKGRVASLLEVGTGFHPELTGRENIYLNGAILGMSKVEIKRKFDEIVAFAEVEKFLDTPVKRYSSGMYVRLAFAVAAHLEPEILIVDEVLAVGDAQFQKKCMGKMEAVGKEGRTVIFVSHNMGAINELCTRAILLSNGTKQTEGSVREVVAAYLDFNTDEAAIDLSEITHLGKQQFARFKKLKLLDGNSNLSTMFEMNTPFVAQIELECLASKRNVEIGLRISSIHGVVIHFLTSTWEGLFIDLEPGSHTFQVEMPHLFLYPGSYTVSLWVLSEPEWSDDRVVDIAQFTVFKGDITGFPTRVDQYVISGCEVYTPSKWKIL